MANDASTRTAREHFLKVATVRSVHVVTAFAGSAAAPLLTHQLHQNLAVHATFRDEESLGLWVSSLQAGFHLFFKREYPAILLECDIGFVLLGRLSKADPKQHASGIIRALRMSNRLADWLHDSAAQAYLANALVFRRIAIGIATDLSKFTLCDRSTGFYDRRSVRKKNALAWQVERNDNDAALLIDLVATLGAPPASPDRFDGVTESTQLPALAQQGPGAGLPEFSDRTIQDQATIVSPLHWSDDDMTPLRQQTAPSVAFTSREQQALARVGQGLFRKRVAEVEQGCRVTGLNELEHLRASHIKPWRDSNDAERLDANNGLLLSPHIDHLFDQGHLTFTPDGTALFAASLSRAVIDQWNLKRAVGVRAFNVKQGAFMEYHRKHVFRGV